MKKKILIVEDEALLSSALGDKLDREGFDVIKRRNGQEGLNTALENLPDLILLDLNMPRMNGREALTEIKKDPMISSIPVIILTTSRQEEDIESTYALGANSFIVKPVNFAAMTKAINTLTGYWFDIVKLPNKKP